MKRRKFLQRVLTGALAGSMVISSVPANTVSAATAAQVAGEISVNPNMHYQTLDGWGTSMCWWGNVIGSWGDKDFNGNGTPDREEIAELAFSPEYLNLNIVRYNVGGGDKEDTSMKRVEGLVPGWTVDMTGTADGTGAFNADAFYAKDITEMNDAGQLWMLDQANKWREKTAKENGTENDIINEVFSNSPPYYMTNSGSSTGGVSAVSNLKTDCYDDFATYMARAGKWIDNYLNKTYGTGVDYIEPMNEPDTNYWAYGSTKQEGCTFETGEEMSNMLTEMKKALAAEGLDDTVEIQATDETSLASAINSFEKLSTEAKNSMTTIGAHTYSGSDAERVELRDLAAAYDKELWMSEITKGKDGNGHDTAHDSMILANTQGQSESMMADLKYMQPSAWVLWLVADSEYECLKVNGNWGLIHAVFESDGPVKDYHTNLFNSDGTVKDGVPGEGYWAVTKQFYVMMQYSKYIKAGYTMIDIGDDDMCAALSPDGKELVIVANNFSGDRTTTIDLTAFKNAATAKVYRTSDEESCELVETQDVSDGILDAALPATSVSTFVVEVETDTDNYITEISADVQTPSDAGIVVSDMNKFTMSGKWTSAKTTTTAGASAVLKFEGDRALIYGTKSSRGAVINVSVDGGEAVEVSLASSKSSTEALLFDTGALESGTHTVEMTVAADQKSKVFTLNGAEIVHGELVTTGAAIRKIIPYSGALKVFFDEVKGASGYTVSYGTSRKNLDTEVTVEENSLLVTGLTDGQTYYFQVTDDKGGVSNIVAGVPGAMNDNIMYYVDAGTDDVNSLASGEEFGVYNSVLDQVYGVDTITGAKWGYVDNSNGAYYSDGDAWTSVRGDEQDTEGKGLEYKFELPAGSYNVTIATKDPWSNSGRAMDYIINGATVDEKVVSRGAAVSGTYQVAMDTDGEMTIAAVRSAGNTSSGDDPLISFIKIEKYDANIVSSVKELSTVYTVAGVIPELPDTVTMLTMSGEEVESAVEWEKITASDFANVGKVTVAGTTVEGGLAVTQSVDVIQANPVYFIDCNLSSSEKYQTLNELAGLKNEAADKAYTEGSWGYLDEYGTCTGSDSYEAGWYAKAGQAIKYTMPLEAGTYDVSFGFHEWWGVTRPMKMVAYYNETSKELGTITINGYNNYIKETQLTLDSATDVTFAVEINGDSDPVLSFLQINNTLNTDALKAVVNEAAVLDNAYLGETGVEALANARTALMSSTATQADVDAAAAALTDVIGSAEDTALASEKAELQTVIDEASAMDKAPYTAKSFAKVEAAVEAAKTVLAKDDVTISELSDAAAAIEAAKAKLVTLESILTDALTYNAADNTNDVYTAKSWSAYEKAYADAAALAEAGNYTEDTLNTAIAALEAACDALVNKLPLGKAIDEAKAITNDGYTEASWNALTAAITAAESVYANADATAAEFEDAKNALVNAKNSLVTVVDEAKNELQTAVKTVEASVKELKEADYTAESWTALQNAITAAKEIYNSTTASADDIKKATNAMNDALNGLVKASVQNPNPEKPDDNQTPVVKETTITLNTSKINMGAGEKKVKLTATVEGAAADQAVTWTSDKTNIVKVKNGVLTAAKKTGTATITATTADGKTATCKVTVKKAPTKITLNAKTKTLKVGKKFTVKVKKYKPSKAASYTLKFTSSNKKVVSVDAKGVVKAKKKGTAKITVKAYNGKKATVKIKVTK